MQSYREEKLALLQDKEYKLIFFTLLVTLNKVISGESSAISVITRSTLFYIDHSLTAMHTGQVTQWI